MVSARDGNRRRLVRRPLDGGDGRLVPMEASDGLATAEGSQVPYAERAVVRCARSTRRTEHVRTAPSEVGYNTTGSAQVPNDYLIKI